MAVLLLMMVTMSMRTAIVIDNERTAMINITLPTSVRGANRVSTQTTQTAKRGTALATKT